MPHFIYKARKSTGEIYSSERDAGDRYEIYRMLKQNGEEVVSVDERSKKDLFANIHVKIPFLGGVKTQEKITFARNLGAMMDAGLAVSRALAVMERQARNKIFKKILTSLIEEVSKGKTLSEAMKMYPDIFSPLFISMVGAGEQSGTLASSLKVVSIQMDRAYSLQRRIKGAMMYPAVIFLVMILVGVLMMIFVVPTLMKTFTELHVALPLSTRVILEISNLIQNHGILMLIGVVILVSLGVTWSKSSQGKKVIHISILKIPVIGNLIKEVNTARTARTLSSLLSSGVDIVESVRITREVLQNIYYKKILEQAAEVIKKGEPISAIFNENINLYPPFMAEMMSVGEETGKVGEMLLNVAVFYEESVEQKTKDMSTIIEPVLMVIIAFGVGFFAVAMISPMYSLADTI